VNTTTNGLMKPDRAVGIVGYGAYVPRYRLPASEVSKMWTNGTGGTPIVEKAVNGLDEDVITMSIEAARDALQRAQINPQEIRAVWVGSESHPTPSSPAAPSWPRPSARCPTRRPATGSSPVRRAPKRCRRPWALSAPAWRATPEHRHGHRPGTSRRRAGIHGGGWRRGRFARTWR
jgi:hypothetical protein